MIKRTDIQAHASQPHIANPHGPPQKPTLVKEWGLPQRTADSNGVAN